jgi:hypothetical protein
MRMPLSSILEGRNNSFVKWFGDCAAGHDHAFDSVKGIPAALIVKSSEG